jgi:hypothetical protein
MKLNLHECSNAALVIVRGIMIIMPFPSYSSPFSPFPQQPPALFYLSFHLSTTPSDQPWQLESSPSLLSSPKYVSASHVVSLVQLHETAQTDRTYLEKPFLRHQLHLLRLDNLCTRSRSQRISFLARLCRATTACPAEARRASFLHASLHHFERVERSFPLYLFEVSQSWYFGEWSCVLKNRYLCLKESDSQVQLRNFLNASVIRQEGRRGLRS